MDAQPVFAADPLPGEAEEVDFDGANGRNVLLVLPERVQEAGPTPTCPDPHLALALRVLYNLRPYTGRVRVGLYCVACRACVEDVPAEAPAGILDGLGPAQVPVSSLRSHGSLVRSGGIPAAGDTPPWTDPRGNAGLAGVHFGREVEAFLIHPIERPTETFSLPVHTRYRSDRTCRPRARCS